MLDIVIPLGKSKIDYLDLQYVLRAIEKFTQPGDVYIIGQKPKWITGVRHIPCEDSPVKARKEQNIFNKTKLAFQYTDRFLFMNDDHVLLKETDIDNYPNYYKGTCYQSMLKNNTYYRQTMNQTRKWLIERGYPDLNYDGHCPLIMEKEHFTSQFEDVNWGVKFGYGMKSIYCAGLPGVYMADKKVAKKINFSQAVEACDSRHVISFTDAPVKTGMGEYLRTVLSFKSKYEI